MTELEQLATNLETKITLEWYTRTERIYPPTTRSPHHRLHSWPP